MCDFKHSIVQHSIVQHSVVQHSVVQHSVVQLEDYSAGENFFVEMFMDEILMVWRGFGTSE